MFKGQTLEERQKMRAELEALRKLNNKLAARVKELEANGAAAPSTKKAAAKKG